MAGDKKVIVNLGKPWTGKEPWTGKVDTAYAPLTDPRRPEESAKFWKSLRDNLAAYAPLMAGAYPRGPFFMTKITEADRKHARFAMSVHCYRNSDWPIRSAEKKLLGDDPYGSPHIAVSYFAAGYTHGIIALLEAGLWGAILGRHYKYQLFRADQGFERRGQRNWKPIQTWDERIVARDYREATTPTRLPE